MKKITIKAAESTSIHNIHSPHFDREIFFKKGEKYAVILASYYTDGLGGVRKARTDIGLKRILHTWEGYSKAIIDSDGYLIQMWGGEPVRMGKIINPE